jgi:hypothetical protein
MFEDILKEAVEHLEEDFYSKKMNFSYSSLKQLMWNPAIFYQLYVLGNKEEKIESHLVQGKLIHCLLLEEQNFDNIFLISPSSLPTGNTRTVIDKVFKHHQELASNGDTRENLEEFKDAIIDVLKDINLHQTLKTDDQRIDKIITPETVSYWNYLKVKQGKTLISNEDYLYCKEAVDVMKQDQSLCDLIGYNANDFNNIEVHNELQLTMDVADKPFGVKGILDNLVIDHDNKKIRVNDVKTTSKDLKDFPETVEFYSYWLQAVIYMTLVHINYGKLIDAGYTVDFHFIVIDKTFLVYPFKVTELTMTSWLQRMKEVLNKAEWHYINKNYALPYDFAVGNVFL